MLEVVGGVVGVSLMGLDVGEEILVCEVHEHCIIMYIFCLGRSELLGLHRVGAQTAKLLHNLWASCF